MKDKSTFILKKASKMDTDFREDLEFAKRTEKAWRRIKKGEGTKTNFDDFIKEMKTW